MAVGWNMAHRLLFCTLLAFISASSDLPTLRVGWQEGEGNKRIVCCMIPADVDFEVQIAKINGSTHYIKAHGFASEVPENQQSVCIEYSIREEENDQAGEYICQMVVRNDPTTEVTDGENTAPENGTLRPRSFFRFFDWAW